MPTEKDAYHVERFKLSLVVGDTIDGTSFSSPRPPLRLTPVRPQSSSPSSPSPTPPSSRSTRKSARPTRNYPNRVAARRCQKRRSRRLDRSRCIRRRICLRRGSRRDLCFSSICLRSCTASCSSVRVAHCPSVSRLLTASRRADLHKIPFSQALDKYAQEPLQSPFASSVTIVILEASAYIIKLVKSWTQVDEVVGPRWWNQAWHAFVAAAAQASLVIKSPGSMLAGRA